MSSCSISFVLHKSYSHRVLYDCSSPGVFLTDVLCPLRVLLPLGLLANVLFSNLLCITCYFVFPRSCNFYCACAHSSKFEMSFSCEKGRTSAYSEDLLWCMVWQSQALSLPSATVARNIGLDISTVRRPVNVFERMGQVDKRAYPLGRAFTVIT